MIAYSVTLFAVAVVFLVLGIEVYKGNTKLIHDYHQENVKESERQEYGRAFSKGMFAIFAALAVSGVIGLFGKAGYIVATSVAVLTVGIIVSVVIIVNVQKKYNGGIF